MSTLLLRQQNHLLALTYFFYFAYFGVTVPFLSVFLHGRGFSPGQIGELMALVTFVRILGPNLWALVADKTGQSLRVMQLGCVLTLSSYLLLFGLTDFWGVSLSFALVMTFWAAIAPQMETISLARVNGDPRKYSRIRLWGSLGFIVASVAAGAILDWWGTESFVYTNTVILGGLLFLSLMLLAPDARAPEKQKVSLWATLRQPVFVFFLLASVLMQFSFAPYYSFFALNMQELNYSSQQIGWLVSLGVIAEILVFLVAGKVLKRNGLTNTLLFCFLVTALRWWLVAFYADKVLILLFSQCIHAFSFGLTHAASMQFVHQHFEPSQKNRGQALYTSISFGVGGSVGSLLAGYLWLSPAGASVVWQISAFAALTGSIMILLMARFIPAKR